MKRILPLFLCIFLLGNFAVSAEELPQVDVNAKAVLLMEAETGRVLYENNAHEALPPASVTKIMTMLLTMEAISRGEISYDTVVTASEHAKEMGGSTIFLNTGEEMTVHDLLKGIAVASGNDACVAMAEHLAGSEEAFVDKMNRRAEELGMKDTHFLNCNGLDADGHVTSCYDIALMSRELIRHEDIFQFTTIWTDSLRSGAFELANTNRLIRFYKGANGLKTGSTSIAGCCISATAKREDMQLIAVVLGAPTSNDRFESAKHLLDYGFANYTLYRVPEDKNELIVNRGTKATVIAETDGFSALVKKGEASKVEAKKEITDTVVAPVSEGQTVGTVEYLIGNQSLGKCDIKIKESIPRITLWQQFCRLFRLYSVDN